MRCASGCAATYEIAAITNDIYTKWDAEYLVRSGALAPERIAGVETGGCPHTAIREDASINLAAVAEMRQKFPDLDLVLIESGGDNLAATFSPELADHHRLRDRRRGGRQDPLQGRARHHALGPAGDQQGRSRAACRRLARGDGARREEDARARGRSCSPTSRPAAASIRWCSSSRTKAGSAPDAYLHTTLRRQDRSGHHRRPRR